MKILHYILKKKKKKKAPIKHPSILVQPHSIPTVLAASPHDQVTDWQLWLKATTQYHEGITLHIASAGKDESLV